MIIDITSMDGFAVLTAMHEGWHFVKEQAAQDTAFGEAVEFFEQQLHEMRAQDPKYDEDARIREYQEQRYRRAGKELDPGCKLQLLYTCRHSVPLLCLEIVLDTVSHRMVLIGRRVLLTGYNLSTYSAQIARSGHRMNHHPS